MKRQTVSKTGRMAIVVVVATLYVSNALAQRRPVTGAAQPRRIAPVSGAGTSVAGPGPMGNPVGRMTNPVQPIIQSPYMPHPAATPAIVTGGYRRGLRNAVAVPVYASAPYYAPYYDSGYFQQIPTAVTIPGLLPGARYEDYRDTRVDSVPYVSPAAAPASSPWFYESRPEPQTRMIIREPQPGRVVQPPAAGASRAEVILQLGQPWGSFTVRGIETLSFDGVTVVIGTDGRVASTR